MPGRTFDAVIESELRQDLMEIADLQPGCETLVATRAVSAIIFRARCLVQLHADLCRSLKDVEELSEW